MICVYESNTVDFDNNGLTVLDKYIKATVIEEVNGEYSLTLIYPLADANKSKYLIKNNIIKANKPNKKEEYFRIEKTRRTEKEIEVLCYQISKDLDRNFLEDVRPTNLNGHNALNWMADRLQYPTLFTFSSDIDTVSSASYIRKNFLDAVMGSDDNSFLKRWGGELDRNKFRFRIVNRLGSDRGFRIERGKNLIEIEEMIEGTETTRIMPTGRDENDKIVMLPERYVDSPLINNYPTPSIKTVDFSDIKVSRPDAETDYPDLEAVYEELRTQANLMYSVQNIDRPKINFNVKISDNSKTREYKKLGILQTLSLGDTVTIFSEKLNLDIKARFLKYEYDCATDKYINLEFGDFVKGEYSANAILENTVIEHKKENSDIANKIKRALEGHVVTREGEILIMDTEDIATMLKNWRWNLNGLAYGEEGYNGNYRTAITMDGEIVADFVKTGTLIADLIKAGILSSANGKTWINMEDGSFSFVDKITFDGSEFKIRLSNGSDLEELITDISLNQEGMMLKFNEIGGNNLVVNSTFNNGQNDWTGWSSSKNIIDAETHKPDSKIIKISSSGLSSDIYHQVWSKAIAVNANANRSFTISFDIKTDSVSGIDSTGVIFSIRMFNVTDKTAQANSVWYKNITKADLINEGLVDGTWVRYSITIKPTTGLYMKVAPYLTRNGVVYWREIKVEEGSVATAYSKHQDELYSGYTKIDRNGVEISNGALKVVNSNGIATIDASKLMLRILTYGNGSLTIANNATTAVATIPHNLGYSPIFKGQFRYINSSGGIETYSDSLNLYAWDTGTLNYNGRMFVDDNNLYINVWRASNLASSGTKTFYYRYFIEEGVNL